MYSWLKRNLEAAGQPEIIFLILSIAVVGMMIGLESSADRNALRFDHVMNSVEWKLEEIQRRSDFGMAGTALEVLSEDSYLRSLRALDPELDALCARLPWPGSGKSLTISSAAALLLSIRSRLLVLQVEERNGFRILSASCLIMLCLSLVLAVLQFARVHAAIDRLSSEKLLSDEKIEMQKSERLHISRELHDGAAQDLARARLLLQAPVLDRADIMRSIDAAIREIRWLCGSFRVPFDTETPLENILEETALAFGSECHVPVRVRVATKRDTRWTPDAKYEIVRIVEEGMTNIERHASATEASLYITEVGDRLHIALDDDGIGLGGRAGGPGEVKPGYGMKGISERCALLKGRAEWTNRAEKGTRLSVDIPLPDSARERKKYEYTDY